VSGSEAGDVGPTQTRSSSANEVTPRAEAIRGCPERPQSATVEELGFVRKPMVRWLDPRQLLDTSTRVVLSGIFGTYSDKREIQALMPGGIYDRSNQEDLWLDYVADLGDGWDPTYTVATLLAAGTLEPSLDGQTHRTERGRILVMGGDAVYPVPKRADYENRTLGPYRAALPCTQDRHPELFAIPGSHDWYDGLVNFTSVFCRQYWIGGWKTRQNRSHFALKLPHGWWLWGVDIQFGDFIDEAQVQYFSDVANTEVGKGDRIILCTARAPGTRGSQPHLYAERNMQYFEREIVAPSGAEVALKVTSGRHHYAHYRETGGVRHHVNAGGGGAFLHPTHDLPEHLQLEAAEGPAVSYERVTTYPSQHDSRRLRKRLWLLPVRNLAFAGFLGGVQVFLAVMLGLHRNDTHESLGVADLWEALWTSPTAVLLILSMVVIFGAMVRFAHDAPGPTRFLLGAAHSTLQLASTGALMIGASALSSSLGLQGMSSIAAFLVFVAALGGLGGALGFAAYLWVTNYLGFHANEAYAPLRVKDHKHFLRLHIGRDGALTVFPIGVDKVCRRWRLCREGPLHAPWFQPDQEEIRPRLLERPFGIGNRPDS
jgi:hypothetical protein